MKLAPSLLLAVNAQWWNPGGILNGVVGTTTLATTSTTSTTTTTTTSTTTTTKTPIIDNTPTIPSSTIGAPTPTGSSTTKGAPTPTGSSTTKGAPTPTKPTTEDWTKESTDNWNGTESHTDTWTESVTENWTGTEAWTESWTGTHQWEDITTISISFPAVTTAARPVDSMSVCERMRDDVLNSNIVGAWVPECSLKGEFTSRQCNYSARTCWCVGKDGDELDGTRQFFADPTKIEDKKCPSLQVEVMTPCQQMRNEVESSMMMGAWLPSCNAEGEFESLQCNASARTCWCVDKKGEAIDGTSQFFEDPSRMYDKKCSVIDTTGPCFSLRDEIDQKGHIQGEYWPQCKEDGHFYEKQCVFKTRSCWCVGGHGEMKSDEVFFDSLERLKEFECKAPTTAKPELTHNQDGLHFHGINIMDMFTNILGQHLPEGLLEDGHKPENYEDIMESILDQTSLANFNFAPVNTNVQNFVNINTEIDTDIDININGQKFGLSGLMGMFSEKMKSNSDMEEVKEKIVDCIKNFHLESYAYKLLPILKATATQNGIKEDEFNKIVHEILSKFQ